MAAIFNKLSTIFSSDDTLPWTDREMISRCESEVAKEGAGITPEKDRNESLMRLAWALVHSREPSNVLRGIAMLEAAFDKKAGPLQTREILYLLAVGHYRNGDYVKSRRLVEQALEIAPDFRQALMLRSLIEDKIAKDGIIGVGIAAAAVGLVASGVACVVAARKR
ncbi:mitochondrial fission 1 protein A [Selaginella moellendorffii]|uniref:mitochondrial fission 1 protein A n=1 Tax=Selaginella moellendorffii TaxID=88036 RepID=UPI000D1CB252|nr:mitochondrial fission 1 protein A [Selaginella moellendorffii]|eukprot:XP_024540050.1 mitochondrial fission 1 protein A [Selaginella moellendorffii]